MPGKVEVAKTLYRALQQADAPALIGVLREDFQGQVTDGFPAGLGGQYDGRDAMLRMWARVVSLFDVRPEPDEYLELAGDGLLVLGRYVGSGRSTGLPLEARFAHLLRIDGDRVRALEQITDSQRWADALTA